MSQLPAALQLSAEDVKMLLACQVHLGTRNCTAGMKEYVYKRRDDGFHVIDIRKTWEKLVLAARVIVAVENAADVCVVAVQGTGTPYAQRAVLKFAKHTGVQAIAGRFTPGTFTNYIQAKYTEPRLLIVTDTLKDHQPLTEASYCNMPVIAFVDTDSSIRGVDIAIPCNNKGKYSIALMYWLLSREVLRLRDSISRQQPWDVMVDMFVYPDQDELEKQEAAQEAQAAAVEPVFTSNVQPTDWNEDESGMWDPAVTTGGITPGGPADAWDGEGESNYE